MDYSSDSEGRVVTHCQTLLPKSGGWDGKYSVELVDGEGEGDGDEAFVAAHAELLHCRMGHVGKVALDRLIRKDLVRGLEGGVFEEVGVCRGCELARSRPHPHHPVEPA